MDVLTQLQTALTPVATIAATAFVGWLFTELRAHFHIAAADSAETAIRTAAATEAGKLAAGVTPAAAGTMAPAALISPSAVAASASKVIADLPKEVGLTGYTSADIADMVLANLPTILGTLNPALGVAATVVKDVMQK